MPPRRWPSCGVPLTVVETNFREFVEPWTYVFGSALAATLFQFSGLAKVGLIAADVDYGMVNLPWGSNLVTNPLLSSSRFEIVTDGAGATRSDKVAAIAQIPALRDRLRVCWEGADKARTAANARNAAVPISISWRPAASRESS